MLYAKVMHAFILFCTVLMIAISVNLEWMGPLFLRQPGYEEGLFIVPTLLMGYLLLGIYFNLSIWFKITDQTKYSFWITLVGAILTIGIIFVFVPIWGYMGGALSTISCYLVMCLLCYFYGQKHYPIPYQTAKGVFYLLISFAVSYLGFYLNLGVPALNFLAKNSLILLYIGLIFLLEKEQIMSFLPKNKKP